MTRRHGGRGSIVRGEAAGAQDGQEHGGRTGYGFTRDSLEDIRAPSRRLTRGGLQSDDGQSQVSILLSYPNFSRTVQGQLQYLARRPTSQVTLSEAGRRGRTGYGFTRDSLEDLGAQPQRRSRGPSLKQGRSRPVPQILELEEDGGEEYDGEYDDYEDEYEYSDEEEEELVWPHEVRPARTRQEPRYLYNQVLILRRQLLLFPSSGILQPPPPQNRTTHPHDNTRAGRKRWKEGGRSPKYPLDHLQGDLFLRCDQGARGRGTGRTPRS